jgi:phosphatidylglycerophosphatase C
MEGSLRPVLAVFDFDGTLTTKDSLLPFFRSLYPTGQWLARLSACVPAMAGYATGLLSNHQITTALTRRFLAGVPLDTAEERARRFAVEELTALENDEAMRRLREHQSQGHRVVIASANLELYIRHWASLRNAGEVVATRLAVHAGAAGRTARLSGELDGPACHGPEKARRLAAHVGDTSRYEVYAYGDSRGDRELLAQADHPAYRSFTRGRGPIIR